MEDLGTRLKSLARPRLLARAAQEGIGQYSRKRDLRRILGTPQQNTPQTAAALLVKLLERERLQEKARRAQAPSYSVVRHLETLIAIAAEGQLFLARRGTESEAAPKENGRSKTGTPAESSSISDRYQRKLSGMDSFFFAT